MKILCSKFRMYTYGCNVCVIVIVITKLLKRHSKAKHTAPSYSRVLCPENNCTCVYPSTCKVPVKNRNFTSRWIY